jgi:hypothetical protein
MGLTPELVRMTDLRRDPRLKVKTSREEDYAKLAIMAIRMIKQNQLYYSLTIYSV